MAEMGGERIGALGSVWAVGVQVCERAAAAEGDGGAYRRARRDGQKSQASERAQQRKARKGQRVPKALLPFSFVSLFSFVLPFALQKRCRESLKYDYQSCGVVFNVASTHRIVSR